MSFIQSDSKLIETGKGACQACGGVMGIINKPLIGNASTANIFWALGVVLISVVIWTRVLAYLKG